MDNNPTATLADTPHVSVADGDVNVSEETVALHQLVNKELGTSYADDVAALQGLKQTKDYVGRVGQVMPFFDKAKERGIPTSKLFEAMDTIVNGQQVIPQPASASTDNLATKDELRSLQRDMFYDKNPQFTPYRQAIDEVANATGKSPVEIVTADAYKSLFENAKGFDEIQKTKSVLQTNSRLGVATDSMTKAQEAMKEGNVSKAQDFAMKGVLEAYDMK